MSATHPEECACLSCAIDPRAEAVTDLATEAARDHAIRGQIEDDHRADMTDRRRTGDY